MDRDFKMAESLVNSDYFWRVQAVIFAGTFLTLEKWAQIRHPLSVLPFSDTPNSKWTLIYGRNKAYDGNCFYNTTSTGIHSGSENRN